MNERYIAFTFHVGGTLSADQTFYCELPVPWTLLGIKAAASNDSDATLAASGGATISATVIGDSGDPAYIEPSSPAAIDADELVTLTLDHDGSTGTAADDVSVIVIGLVGDG